MSAIGSVIVMRFVPSRSGFAVYVDRRPATWLGALLPGALGDAGQFAAVRHLAEADPAQAELAVDGLGAAAALAAGVTPHLELRRLRSLDLESSLRHVSSP